MYANLIIAIDGYSSCGKSTVAKALARKLKLHYIDSGAMYRAVTLFFLENNIPIPNPEEVNHNGFNYNEVLNRVHISFKINDKTVVDYTEPANVKREEGDAQRIISNGTFALQGHDPKSKVFFKNLLVKVLPD